MPVEDGAIELPPPPPPLLTGGALEGPGGDQGGGGGRVAGGAGGGASGGAGMGVGGTRATLTGKGASTVEAHVHYTAKGAEGACRAMGAKPIL